MIKFGTGPLGKLLCLMASASLAGCTGQEAKDAVRERMRDPDAAQFRGVKQCSGDRSVWQGEVNGKNAFGAYTGFKQFYYADGVVTDENSGSLLAMMNRCYNLAPSGAPSVDVSSPPAM